MAYPSTYGPGQIPQSHPEVSLSLTSLWIRLLCICLHIPASLSTPTAQIQISSHMTTNIESWSVTELWSFQPPNVDSLVFLSLKLLIEFIKRWYITRFKIQRGWGMREKLGTLPPCPQAPQVPPRHPHAGSYLQTVSACDREPLLSLSLPPRPCLLCIALPLAFVPEPRVVLLATYEASKLVDKIFGWGIMTLFGRPSDGEDGRLVSQKNHLTRVRIQVSFTPENCVLSAIHLG